LVTWKTNRNISDKQPERYLAERRDGTEIGDEEIKERLASHLIPYAEVVGADYTELLATRVTLVYDAMMKLCTVEGIQ
jgi:hypothetical protein